MKRRTNILFRALQGLRRPYLDIASVFPDLLWSYFKYWCFQLNTHAEQWTCL